MLTGQPATPIQPLAAVPTGAPDPTSRGAHAFATGYGDGFRIPEDLAEVPVVKKPFEAEDLLRAFQA
ncbi:hypothetical protein OMR07_19080 [Methylobacterium organophilum]|nr:hypothetical protein [Methylobacterium organophilum]